MILNIYKPMGFTSFDVVAKVRAILKRSTGNKKLKVGHAGALDPLAEGVLVVLTGDDTKKQNEFMELPKEYFAKIAFGVKSASYDLETNFHFSEKVPTLEEMRKKVPRALKKFIGDIEQAVPPYSAVKIAGKRLYREARKREIPQDELPVKRVSIYDIEIVSLENEIVPATGALRPTLTCIVKCGSGTYIRSLAHDLGSEIGTGGVLTQLQRTKIGDYKIENAIKIEALPALLE